LTLYRGLESGHVGLVSAISASYAGVTVILSVLVLGERLTAAGAAGGAAAGFLAVLVLGGRLTAAAAAGVTLTVAGVVLASSRASPGAEQTALATGVAFGLAAAGGYGVGGLR